MKLSHRQAVFLMVAVTLMWSIAGVVTRQLEQARSFEVTFWRSFFTAVSLLVILPFFQGREVFAKLRAAPAALWVSGLCWSVMFTAFMVALTLTSVANVLIAMALGPFLTALLSRIFIGHRIPLRTWTAIVVEIRPAHPISRLAAPSSASTKASAFSSASSEMTTVSASGGGVTVGELSAAMFPPRGGVVPPAPEFAAH